MNIPEKSNQISKQIPKEPSQVSGRWILALVAGICFFMFSLTSCIIIYKKSSELQASEVLLFTQSFNTIIVTVFAFYFTKKRLTNDGQINQDDSDISDDTGPE